MHASQVEANLQERLEKRVAETAADLRERLVETARGLIRIPSENTPPTGAELAVQEFIHNRIADLGMASELYELGTVPGLEQHPIFRRNRDYAGRPNVRAVLKGSGGGKSLLLSGHADTVPRGSEPWTRDPFAGSIEGNILYGLGANDMKSGIAAMILAVEVLKQSSVSLKGDLLFETIVDEEFGGVSGTLAGRLGGHNADAVVVCEPSQEMICPAQTGGRTVHIALRGTTGGILYGSSPVSSAEQIHHILGAIREFARRRRLKAPVHPMYAGSNDPVPVWVTKIAAGGWGTSEPITVPASAKIELYWQAMPGETREEIDREFEDWFNETVSARRDLFPVPAQIDFPIEWLPGSAIPADHELVSILSQTYLDARGAAAPVTGIGGPCDMFVFHQHFQTPALLFGPRGGNTHAPDEWVDLDSVAATLEVLSRFITRWCGVDWERTRI